MSLIRIELSCSISKVKKNISSISLSLPILSRLGHTMTKLKEANMKTTKITTITMVDMSRRITEQITSLMRIKLPMMLTMNLFWESVRMSMSIMQWSRLSIIVTVAQKLSTQIILFISMFDLVMALSRWRETWHQYQRSNLPILSPWTKSLFSQTPQMSQHKAMNFEDGVMSQYKSDFLRTVKLSSYV